MKIVIPIWNEHTQDFAGSVECETEYTDRYAIVRIPIGMEGKLRIIE